MRLKINIGITYKLHRTIQKTSCRNLLIFGELSLSADIRVRSGCLLIYLYEAKRNQKDNYCYQEKQTTKKFKMRIKMSLNVIEYQSSLSSSDTQAHRYKTTSLAF